MKAVVWHGLGDIRLDEVPDPTIQESNDAIVRITTSAICGTDLHMVRGTMSGMKPGTVLGHEAVGVVEETGPGVRNLPTGTRVVIGSTIACGYCSYCRSGTYSQCDNANPNGRNAGTAFFGGPEPTGPFDGMQAEYVRVPFANVGAVPVPENVTDDQAIMVSDIFPTAWFGGRLAEIGQGDTVAVFGAGPVGQFSVLSAYLQGAGRVFVVDGHASRLEAARRLGAEAIDFNAEDPVAVLQELTGGAGPDRVIDAVGVDSESAKSGPAAQQAQESADQFRQEVSQVAPESGQQGEQWKPGDAPSQAAQWAVAGIAKAGTIGVVGVYPETVTSYPFGPAFMKNLTIRTGNCPHRRYIPDLLRLVASGVVDPARVITQQEPLTSSLQAFEAFDRRDEGWVKTVLST
ncbi:zinc-dependent alcohol dehydrogenase [Motilibacter deserti]|uniref:Glutathione-dependent formaldehyde dehydrogenase n=1 Tax=Motilibacter deserti TaxID=2714956 RepID=A0ABX0GWX5_9ACTN|nr:zinc-dependent alcohol dehydrogenase [Motilibacter deserti]NHC14191.1 glutathione-dependent formaldehyde dehydrogenase [Motilibacter deserti]